MDVAAGRTERSRVPTPLVARELASALLFLSAVGLVAIGVSGVLSAAFGAAFGKDFVAGDAPGIVYSADRCAEFMEYAPAATTCREAATIHHDAEIVDYRIAAGVLGLLALGAYAFARRRRWTETPDLPSAFTSTIGATAFGLAAVALLGSSLNQVVLGERAGVGQDLSGGIVSAVVAAAFGWSLLSTLLGRGRRAER
jgi:uncharacterized protein (DUF697 family)